MRAFFVINASSSDQQEYAPTTIGPYQTNIRTHTWVQDKLRPDRPFGFDAARPRRAAPTPTHHTTNSGHHTTNSGHHDLSRHTSYRRRIVAISRNDDLPPTFSTRSTLASLCASLNLLPRQIPRRKALDTLTELCCARHGGLALNNPTHCSRWQRAVCESEGVQPLAQAEARRRTSSTHVSTLRFRRCMFSAASVSVCRGACGTCQWETWALASFASRLRGCAPPPTLLTSSSSWARSRANSSDDDIG